MHEKKGFVMLGGLKVAVEIVDRRRIYGRDEVKITPAAGSGEKWITLGNFIREDPPLTFIEESIRRTIGHGGKGD